MVSLAKRTRPSIFLNLDSATAAAVRPGREPRPTKDLAPAPVGVVIRRCFLLPPVESMRERPTDDESIMAAGRLRRRSPVGLCDSVGLDDVYVPEEP